MRPRSAPNVLHANTILQIFYPELGA